MEPATNPESTKDYTHGGVREMSKLQGQIEEIASFEANHTIVAVNSLVADIVKSISLHAAIPEEELMRWIEDSL